MGMTLAIHPNDPVLTTHARERMSARSISPSTIQKVIQWGRVARVRGATIYAVGRKEVARLRRSGVDLTDAEGVHVVCTHEDVVMTAYRNRDFRCLRPRRPKSRQKNRRKPSFTIERS